MSLINIMSFNLHEWEHIQKNTDQYASTTMIYFYVMIKTNEKYFKKPPNKESHKEYIICSHFYYTPYLLYQ